MDKPMFMSFGDVRIKLSNIKNYGISSEKRTVYYVKVYTKKTITGKGLFGKPWSKDEFKWENEIMEIAEKNIRPLPEYGLDGLIEVLVYNPETGADEWTDCRLIKDEKGRIMPGPNSLALGGLRGRDDIIEKEKAVDYLYVTTYQNDNYRFYIGEVPFDIHEKLKEIDQYML